MKKDGDRPITIRKATLSDASAIAALHRQILGRGWPLPAIRSDLADPAKTYLLAGTPPNIAGYLSAFLIAPDEAEILNVAVRPGRRRQGIGRLLVAHLLHDLAEQGVERIFLEVASKNLPALSLYRSHAFKSVSRRKHYYTDPPDDALILMRRLP